jgi:putative DNA primase/helicase
MEGVAAMFNDGLLALDEISECDPRDIGAIVYALGNGRGKQRASRSGLARSVTRWRCCIVSSGERTIETAMHEGGYRVKAGQSVRLLDIPVQRTHGAWDTLHSHASGNAFSDAIKRAAASHYGHAGRAYLEKLTRHHGESFSDALAGILNLPAFAADGDGQVKRAASRFALLALAGELASRYGVTGWQAGAATAAASDLFAAWKRQRGSTGANMEQAQIKSAVLGFIEQHGASRFQDMDKLDATVHNRAGWREASSSGARYLFTSSGMKEALKGFDMGRATDILIQCGALPQPGADGKRSARMWIHGERIRVYAITPDELREADHGIA